MYEQERERKTKKQLAGSNAFKEHKKKVLPTDIEDKRLESKEQLSIQAKVAHNAKTQKKGVVKKKANNTGLPDNLKSGIENLSGHSMDDVKVHYNSVKPQMLQAHAYAQGTNIHLAPGQEKHLPHEAWHVAQQKQGRVKPTVKLGGVPINDNDALEKEADIMSEKALQTKAINSTTIQKQIDTSAHETAQLVATGGIVDMPTLIAAVQADAQIQTYEGSPSEYCEAAAAYLEGQLGAFTKQFLGIGIWQDDASPVMGDHLLTVVTIGGVNVALDVTAGQFGGGPIYDTFANWETAFLNKNAIAGKGIQYKVFSNARSAATETEGLFFGGRSFGEYTGTILQHAQAGAQANAGNFAPDGGGGGRRRKCFITTACVQYQGLADDCMELETLRHFRDNYILNQPNGKELVWMYYEYAPGIVRAIDAEANAADVYNGLFKVITTCVSHIQAGKFEEAYQIYIEMVLKLSRQYIPDVKTPEFLNTVIE